MCDCVSQPSDTIDILELPVDILQIISAYLLNDIIGLQFLKDYFESQLMRIDTNKIFYYALKAVLPPHANLSFNSNVMRFTVEELVFFTKTTLNLHNTLTTLLFACVRKGTFPNLTSYLLPLCSFRHKLKALEMVGPPTLQGNDVPHFELPLLALIGDLWKQNQRETRVVLKERLRCFERVYDFQVVDRFVNVTSKFDGEFCSRHWTLIWRIVSPSYLEILVKEHKSICQNCKVKFSFFSL